jgi:sporulation protein YlmC with PRC-barrel domain
MLLKTGPSVAVLTLLFGVTTAMAQTSPPAQRPAPAAPPAATEAPKAPVTGQILVQDAGTILAKQDLVGQTVYAPDKAKIGAISDLILSQDAKTVEGFVIGVGGFLGIGEKSVALKIDRLKTTPSAEGTMQLTMDVKKEELTNTPVFRSKKEMDAEKQAAERARNLPATPQPKN